MGPIQPPCALPAVPDQREWESRDWVFDVPDGPTVFNAPLPAVTFVVSDRVVDPPRSATTAVGIGVGDSGEGKVMSGGGRGAAGSGHDESAEPQEDWSVRRASSGQTRRIRAARRFKAEGGGHILRDEDDDDQSSSRKRTRAWTFDDDGEVTTVGE